MAGDTTFMADPRRKCRGKWNLYFDDTVENLAATRTLCAQCPLFTACTTWTLANYPDLPFGIFAGLSPQQRRRIWNSEEQWRDWRPGWNDERRKLAIRAAVRKNNGKLAYRLEGIPRCPQCGRQDTVRRDGSYRGRQRYRCAGCVHPVFYEEET